MNSTYFLAILEQAARPRSPAAPTRKQVRAATALRIRFDRELARINRAHPCQGAKAGR